jgi:hypothetical protein
VPFLGVEDFVLRVDEETAADVVGEHEVRVHVELAEEPAQTALMRYLCETTLT